MPDMEMCSSTGLNVALIAPERGTKYSPNLYRWLTSKRNKTRMSALRVYRDTEGAFWIGMLVGRELFGSKLIAVLCNGAREETAAWQGIDAVEIPGFWDRYTVDGRCAIDEDHTMGFINGESRWSVSGDARTCQWCGKHSQTLKRWTEQVQREEWVNPT